MRAHPCGRAGIVPGLFRRRHDAFLCTSLSSSSSSSSSSMLSRCSALRVGAAGVRYRSLPPDDPFGERSSWEDPSDGIYSAWKDVDQEGFVSAADSADVRRAHFGPEWSRFTTVGRLSVKKMQEDPRHQTRAEGQPSHFPSAEEAHARELAERRQVLSRNYATYEEYVMNELGGGNDHGGVDDVAGGDEDGAAVDQQGERCGAAAAMSEGERGEDATAAAAMRTEAEMELAFSELDGLDGRDRMARRSPAREALLDAEAAAAGVGDEETELPAFMCGPGAAAAAETAATTTAPESADVPTPSAVPTEGIVRPSASSSSSSSASPSSSGRAVDVPAEFVARVLAALPGHHGDAAIPLVDPVEWQTAHIVRFLQLFENYSSSAAAATPTSPPSSSSSSSSSSSVMDESMVDAFELANVDGPLLLNVVTPPRLFRVLRRWHVRRQEAVLDAWRRSLKMGGNGGGPSSDAAAIADAVTKASPRLDEAVSPVTPLLIQETILLCFPYAR